MKADMRHGILTYETETRADTSRAIQMMQPVEMRIVQMRTVRDRARKEDLLEQSNIQDIK